MIELWPQWLRPLWLLVVPLLGWLLPLLAATYALHAAQEEVAGDLHGELAGRRDGQGLRAAVVGVEVDAVRGVRVLADLHVPVDASGSRSAQLDHLVRLDADLGRAGGLQVRFPVEL